MDLQETVRFRLDDTDKQEINKTFISVYRSLERKAIIQLTQIIGYVLSGDPAYIPRYNDARNQIRKHERDEIIEELVALLPEREWDRPLMRIMGCRCWFKNCRVRYFRSIRFYSSRFGNYSD